MIKSICPAQNILLNCTFYVKQFVNVVSWGGRFTFSIIILATVLWINWTEVLNQNHICLIYCKEGTIFSPFQWMWFKKYKPKNKLFGDWKKVNSFQYPKGKPQYVLGVEFNNDWNSIWHACILVWTLGKPDLLVSLFNSKSEIIRLGIWFGSGQGSNRWLCNNSCR